MSKTFGSFTHARLHAQSDELRWLATKMQSTLSRSITYSTVPFIIGCRKVIGYFELGGMKMCILYDRVYRV